MQSSIISSRVTGAFIVVLIVLVLAFVASVHTASRLPDLDAAVSRARDVLEEVRVTNAVLRQVETARRGYFRSRQKPVLELYLTATKDAVSHLDTLRELTTGDPLQRQRADAISPLVAQQLTLVTNAIASPAQPTEKEAAAVTAPDDGTVLSEQIHGLMIELEDDARARLREREAEASARTAKAIRGFGTIALIALLLLGGAYYLLDRDAAVHAAVLRELHAYDAHDVRPPDPSAS